MMRLSFTSIERIGGAVAGIVTAVGLVVAGLLVPSAIDRISDTDAHGIRKVLLAARHTNEIRVGYLFLIAALLCIAPATRRVLMFAPRRGRVLVNVAWRLMAVGAAAGAVGNAFAPLVVPSTAAGFDPGVMGAFVHHHETSAVSYGIIAIYLLLPVGALLLILGLLRAGTIPWWGAAVLGLSLAAITPLRLGPQAVVDGVLVAGALTLLHTRQPPEATADPGPR
jgi:hypothetical protein